jgi:hypothetical protein
VSLGRRNSLASLSLVAVAGTMGHDDGVNGIRLILMSPCRLAPKSDHRDAPRFDPMRPRAGEASDPS